MLAKRMDSILNGGIWEGIIYVDEGVISDVIWKQKFNFQVHNGMSNGI